MRAGAKVKMKGATRIKIFPSALFCLLLLFLLPPKLKLVGQTTTEAYKREIFQWKNERLKKLKAKDSWLSLVGLFWLQPGENSFGRGGEVNFRLRDEALPAEIGVFTLKESEVTFTANEKVTVLCQKKPISTITLKDDSSPNPTLLSIGTYSWYIIKRGERLGVRVKNSNHPKLKNFKGIPSFPINSEWCIKANLHYHKVPKVIETPTILGTIVKQTSPGALVFYIKGKRFTLHPVGEGKNLSIVFGDKTNGKETYGGGRFISVEKPDRAGNTYIDFNKAYNPPCVFSKFATCPMPSPVNILNIRVTAGERMIPH